MNKATDAIAYRILRLRETIVVLEKVQDDVGNQDIYPYALEDARSRLDEMETLLDYLTRGVNA